MIFKQPINNITRNIFFIMLPQRYNQNFSKNDNIKTFNEKQDYNETGPFPVQLHHHTGSAF